MADVSLVVDPEFKRLLPELTPAEYSQLEAALINDGCREPIVVWNNIIIDGHQRYEICKKNRIPFRLEQKRLAERLNRANCHRYWTAQAAELCLFQSTL